MVTCSSKEYIADRRVSTFDDYLVVLANGSVEAASDLYVKLGGHHARKRNFEVVKCEIICTQLLRTPH